MLLVWNDYAVLVNTVHVSGAIMHRKKDNATVLVGIHEGRPMGLEATPRDLKGTFDAINHEGHAVLDLPLLVKKGEEAASLRLVLSHVTIIGASEDGKHLSLIHI